jgi:hypothetical protein
LLGLLHGELQALLDFDTFSGPKVNTHQMKVACGRIKGLVATSFLIMNVFANDFPVAKLKYSLSKNFVGMT